MPPAGAIVVPGAIGLAFPAVVYQAVVLCGGVLFAAVFGRARQVIESLAGDFEPEALKSDYRRDLRALLEAKMRGEEIAVPEEPEEEAPVIDLMEALRASVAQASKKPAKKEPAAKPARTRKTASAGSRKR